MEKSYHILRNLSQVKVMKDLRLQDRQEIFLIVIIFPHCNKIW